jgi:putative Holliday junction resolvase
VAQTLQLKFPDLPIRLVDERLSTAAATRLLQASGRNSRNARSVIDQAAAVGILEQAIEYERSTGSAPGELFAVTEGLN